MTSVCLTGGEPVHHPHLRTLVRSCHQFGLPVSLVTSARTPADVARLKTVGLTSGGGCPDLVEPASHRIDEDCRFVEVVHGLVEFLLVAMVEAV